MLKVERRVVQVVDPGTRRGAKIPARARIRSQWRGPLSAHHGAHVQRHTGHIYTRGHLIYLKSTSVDWEEPEDPRRTSQAQREHATCPRGLGPATLLLRRHRSDHCSRVFLTKQPSDYVWSQSPRMEDASRSCSGGGCVRDPRVT